MQRGAGAERLDGAERRAGRRARRGTGTGSGPFGRVVSSRQATITSPRSDTAALTIRAPIRSTRARPRTLPRADRVATSTTTLASSVPAITPAPLARVTAPTLEPLPSVTVRPSGTRARRLREAHAVGGRQRELARRAVVRTQSSSPRSVSGSTWPNWAPAVAGVAANNARATRTARIIGP